MDDLTAGNPSADTGGTATATAEPANGTGTQNGEASQSATGSETFIPEGVDINSLPPSLRAQVEKINKDMVRGFTEKTTKLSETIKSEAAKASEAYRDKASLYEQIASQEEFVKQWNEYVQKTQSQTGKPPEAGDPVLSEMRQQLQEMNQKIQMTELTKVTDSFADAVDEKGAKLHPDFDDLNGIIVGKVQNGKSTEEYSLLRASIELAPGASPQEKLANGYRAAKATYDSIFEAGRKAGVGHLQKKSFNGSLPPTNSSGDVLSMTDKKPKNAHEAMQMAKKGIRVSVD